MRASQPSSLAISGSSASSRRAPIRPPDILDIFRLGTYPKGLNPPFCYYGTENWDKAREENPHVHEPHKLRKILED
jgi:hypothetical protein